MVGTTLNLLGIVAGALLGRCSRVEPAATTQTAFKVLLGAFTVWTGLSTVWASVSGTFLQVLGQLGIAVLALMLGHACGRLFRIQAAMNRMGTKARETFEHSLQPRTSTSFDGAFQAAVVFFAANPLGIYGALLDGTSGNWKPLAIKAAMDGLSALTFARTLGWGTVAAVIPVAALQGSVTLLAQAATLHWLGPAQVQALGATAGLLVFTVSLVVLNLKKVNLADYLPSLLMAPLLAWLFRGTA